VTPISPENRKLYPKNWKAIRAEILERAGHRCECVGECGLHGPSLFREKAKRCVERHGEPARWAKGRIVLTIAHLNHNPKDNRRRNLAALCQRCHNRYDVEHRKKNRAKTIAAKRRER